MAEERTLDANRTCMNCIKNSVCKHFDRLEKLMGDLPQFGAPAKADVLYIGLANCCLLYQKNKKP